MSFVADKHQTMPSFYGEIEIYDLSKDVAEMTGVVPPEGSIPLAKYLEGWKCPAVRRVVRDASMIRWKWFSRGCENVKCGVYPLGLGGVAQRHSYFTPQPAFFPTASLLCQSHPIQSTLVF